MQTYIDCLHLKKTDKSRLHIEDPMECDDNNSTSRINVDDESPEYRDKVLLFFLLNPAIHM